MDKKVDQRVLIIGATKNDDFVQQRAHFQAHQCVERRYFATDEAEALHTLNQSGMEFNYLVTAPVTVHFSGEDRVIRLELELEYYHSYPGREPDIWGHIVWAEEMYEDKKERHDLGGYIKIAHSEVSLPRLLELCQNELFLLDVVLWANYRMELYGNPGYNGIDPKTIVGDCAIDSLENFQDTHTTHTRLQVRSVWGRFGARGKIVDPEQV